VAKPAQNLGNRFDRFPRGDKRPADHHYRQREVARRIDLGRGSVSAGIPCDNNVGMKILQHGPITRTVERPTRHDHLRIRQQQWIPRRINQPEQVNVLRVRNESLQMLPADAEEYTARRVTESLRRCRDIIHLDPAVASRALPSRPFQRQQRHSGGLASLDGVRAHLRRERMGRINNAVDILSTEIVRETSDAAKAADAPGNRRRQRISGAAGIGQHRIDTRIICQSCRQPVRIGGATEDQNAQPSRWRGCHDREQ
jgi:hypothetical protein